MNIQSTNTQNISSLLNAARERNGMHKVAQNSVKTKSSNKIDFLASLKAVAKDLVTPNVKKENAVNLAPVSQATRSRVNTGRIRGGKIDVMA